MGGAHQLCTSFGHLIGGFVCVKNTLSKRSQAIFSLTDTDSILSFCCCRAGWGYFFREKAVRAAIGEMKKGYK